MTQLTTVTVNPPWDNVFQWESKAALEVLLPNYVRTCRWFGGKAQVIRSVEIVETIPLVHVEAGSYITYIQVNYTQGQPQTYMLPLAYASGEHAARIREETSHAVVAYLQVASENEDGVLYDAVRDREFAIALLETIGQGRVSRSNAGEIVGTSTLAFGLLAGPVGESLEPRVMRAEQSNTSIVYGDRFILKLFRRFEEGVNPDLEIGLFLTEKGFGNIPAVAGAIEYRREGRDPATLALLQGFVPNRGDAWQYTLDSLGEYFRAGVGGSEIGDQGSGVGEDMLPSQQHPLDLIEEEVPIRVREAIGPYLESARLLGRRTAELHVALASDARNPDFAPEPFSGPYQQFAYHSMRGLASQAFHLLGNHLETLPEAEQAEAQIVFDRQEQISALFEPLVKWDIKAARIRCHGDYHLGQVLYTGDDFIIIDFEGEPIRSLDERRRKHSPLKDVAGMLRSFHYAAYAAMFSETARAVMDQREDLAGIEQWTDAWHLWVSAAFLKEYLAVAADAPILPRTRQELQALLDAYLLEKAIYELVYELNNRPDWVRIPLQGIMQLLKS